MEIHLNLYFIQVKKSSNKKNKNPRISKNGRENMKNLGTLLQSVHFLSALVVNKALREEETLNFLSKKYFNLKQQNFNHLNM